MRITLEGVHSLTEINSNGRLRIQPARLNSFYLYMGYDYDRIYVTGGRGLNSKYVRKSLFMIFSHLMKIWISISVLLFMHIPLRILILLILRMADFATPVTSSQRSKTAISSARVFCQQMVLSIFSLLAIGTCF